MPCVRVRAKLSCHDCAHEWVDACSKHNIHEPGTSTFCQNCIRNPTPQHFPSRDFYITTEEFMGKVLEQLEEAN